ncbi:hypothetical protein Pcinc_009025 [Petrolisthes cinctipes]|uniref:Uncharacterized protein n=1 Tax=Petrolisthes cinctipes TaxID=88211 RepID=A0AAE1KVW8_PETCI|nr:hypothetical protein Pcinc_009025 [Petrolisthes cinctipes]
MEERVRVRLRRRIVPDRSNPFEDLAEEQFLLRFRLSKECVLNLLQNITEQLPIAADARGCPIPQHLQVLITLRNGVNTVTSQYSSKKAFPDNYSIPSMVLSNVLRSKAQKRIPLNPTDIKDLLYTIYNNVTTEYSNALWLRNYSV